MKKIFIFMICVLFGMELYGGVWCNNDGGYSRVELISGPKVKVISSFNTDSEDVIRINTPGTYKLKLVGDNIHTLHEFNHWDQLSLRIQTAFASKVSVKITKVYEHSSSSEMNTNRIWFKFFTGNDVYKSNKRERGGLCFNEMLDYVEAGGYPKQREGEIYLPANDTVNIVFEGTQPAYWKYKKFKFEAEITVEPDDREPRGENKFRIVNDQWEKEGDDENLYTQIIKKPFNVKLITNYNRNNLSLVGSNMYIDTMKIELYSGKDVIYKIDDQNKMKKLIDKINFKNNDEMWDYDLGGNFGKKFVVDRAKNYSDLYFKVYVTYTDKYGGGSGTGSISNRFTARPAKFRKINSFNKKDNLIGGKKYYPQAGDKNDFMFVEALDNDGRVIEDYNAILKDQRLEFDRSENGANNKNNWCTVSTTNKDGSSSLLPIDENKPENVWVKFEKGRGAIYTKCDNKEFNQQNINNKSCYFIYPEVGHTKISLIDDVTTAYDQSEGDCIENTQTPNSVVNGKIGCYVKLDDEKFHKFIPSSINFVSRDILNYHNDDKNNIGVTYLSKNGESYALSKTDYNNISMAATLNLGVEAHLADGTLPKLYSKNCYAKSIKFSLKDSKSSNRDIKFYGLKHENKDENKDKNAYIAIKFPNYNTTKDKVFWIDENTFSEGKSLTQVKMSIDKTDKGVNPIIVKTSDISIKDAGEFSGDISKVKNLEGIKNLIRNDKIAINAPDIKNDNDKTGNFFYGSLIVPDVSIDEEKRKSGDKATATAYYSVFCDSECINSKEEIYKNIITKTIGDNRSSVPGNQGFYISKFVNNNTTTEYEPEDNNVKIIGNEKETKDGSKQVDLTYSPTTFVRKNIKFTPYLAKDGKKIEAEWLYPIKDTSTKDTFYVEFAPNTAWFGTGKAGKVMGIGEDYDGKSTNEEQKGKRQPRIDW